MKIILIVIAVLMTFEVTYFVFAQSINQYFFISGNKDTMKKLMEPDQLNAVRTSIETYFGNTDRNYSLQDLFEWEGHKLSFVQGMFPWLGFGRPAADPKDIINAGLGKCGEYAILYTAACLSVGIEARIAVVTKSDFSVAPHEFCMVNVNGSWVQVDPSCYTPKKLVFNDTSPYQTWDWGPRVGKDYSIFDFDANNAYNVTSLFV
jgi:transglutaminase-like putative cysteine protease